MTTEIVTKLILDLKNQLDSILDDYEITLTKTECDVKIMPKFKTEQIEVTINILKND